MGDIPSRSIDPDAAPPKPRRTPIPAAAARPVKPLLETTDLEGLAKYIKEKDPRHVICMVGAGMSTSAGVPDFRTPGTGLYANLQRYNLPSPEDIFDIDYFREHPDAFYELAKDLWPTGKKYAPTVAHCFLKLLEEQGKLLRCYTQNVDTLELLAGLSHSRLIAAHGNFATAHALNGAKVPIEELEQAVLSGQEGTRALAEKYGALVKPDIVFFGEQLPKRFTYGVGSDFPKCDLLIVFGTSLTVAPFNQLVARAPAKCPRVLVNREAAGKGMPGGFRFGAPDHRDVLVKGECDDFVRRLCQRLGYTEKLEAICRRVGRGLAAATPADGSAKVGAGADAGARAGAPLEARPTSARLPPAPSAPAPAPQLRARL